MSTAKLGVYPSLVLGLALAAGAIAAGLPSS
jgi:hypothetical protein